MNIFVVAVVHVFDVDVDVDAVNVYAEIVVAVVSGCSVDVYVEVDVGVVTKQLLWDILSRLCFGTDEVVNFSS